LGSENTHQFQPSGRSSANSVSISRVVAVTFALGFLAVALALLGTFPVVNIALLAGAFLYAGLLVWRPELWLVLLPVLLPTLYLATWSGRLFFDEFDALLLLTLAAALGRGRYAVSFRAMSAGSRLLLTAFFATYLAALLKGFLPLPEIDANAFANYYSKLNSLRVGKGLIWALLLYPAWVAERRISAKRAQSLLVAGLAIGAFCVFLVVLWERKVFYALAFWTNKYAFIEALLDFSTQYRVTALFADMHTGGTAIDGYLLLVLPFAAMALFRARSRMEMVIGAVLFTGLMYACVTTFSRGVYLGMGAAVVATTFLVVRQHRERLRPATLLLAVLAATGLVAASFVAYRSGGYITLFYLITAFATSAALVVFTLPVKRNVLLGGLALLMLALIVLAMPSISVRHNEFRAIPAIILALTCISAGALTGWYIARSMRLFLTPLQAGVSVLAIIFCVGLLTPSLFGFRMEQRFSSVKEDLVHRMEHWQTAVDIMDQDFLTTLFGQGLGRFPEHYFWKHQNAKDVGGFVFEQQQGNTFVRFFGAKDVRLGQRASLQPNTNYVLTLDLRTSDERALLYLRACHRQIIQPFEWNPSCVQFKEVVESTGGRWERFEFPFNSKNLGTLRNNARAPQVFTIANRREYAFENRPQTTLDFDNVSIRDVRGVEQLVNGDFEAGVDRWFAYYDFNHLPWHIKNLWVHVYFELGLVGLTLFLFVIGSALRATAKAAGGSKLAFAIFVSIIGFLAVGSFGTLIDSPRIAFLFYFLVILGLGFGRWRVPARSNYMQRPAARLDTRVG